MQELLAHGLLKGDVDAMLDVHLGAVFMPHGLGHLMGIDTHDVGGYPEVGSSTCACVPSLTCAGRGAHRRARPAQAAHGACAAGGHGADGGAWHLLHRPRASTAPPIYLTWPQLLDTALSNPAQRDFLVPEEISKACAWSTWRTRTHTTQFRGFGGVRIEDDIAVTATGCELLTQARRVRPVWMA